MASLSRLSSAPERGKATEGWLKCRCGCCVSCSAPPCKWDKWPHRGPVPAIVPNEQGRSRESRGSLTAQREPFHLWTRILGRGKWMLSVKVQRVSRCGFVGQRISTFEQNHSRRPTRPQQYVEEQVGLMNFTAPGGGGLAPSS